MPANARDTVPESIRQQAGSYRSTEFNISNQAQAKAIVDALQSWMED